MSDWAKKQIQDLERTRMDMYHGIERAKADCRKPGANIIALFHLATAEIKRLGGVPKNLEIGK